MLTYRATLRPLSATRSPWQADTLFGHLCWLIRYEEGAAALDELLMHYRRGAPPLLLSNGFPNGWLPRPLLPDARPPERGDKRAQVAALEAAQEARSIRWVGLADFDALRRGSTAIPLARPALGPTRSVLKNQINRLTGSITPSDETAQGGSLYDVDELAFVDTTGVRRAGLDVAVYVRAADERWAARAEDLLRRLTRGGYGAKKSAGYGHFDLAGWERFEGFDSPLEGANGFISLSNWVPARADPTAGYYATLVKYGKLGEELANAENPFKFPLTMLAAGSAFYADAPIRDWYGRLVEGIAPAEPRVVQYGYAFAVPAQLMSEGRP